MLTKADKGKETEQFGTTDSGYGHVTFYTEHNENILEQQIPLPLMEPHQMY